MLVAKSCRLHAPLRPLGASSTDDASGTFPGLPTIGGFTTTSLSSTPSAIGRHMQQQLQKQKLRAKSVAATPTLWLSSQSGIFERPTGTAPTGSLITSGLADEARSRSATATSMIAPSAVKHAKPSQGLFATLKTHQGTDRRKTLLLQAAVRSRAFSAANSEHGGGAKRAHAALKVQALEREQEETNLIAEKRLAARAAAAAATRAAAAAAAEERAKREALGATMEATHGAATTSLQVVKPTKSMVGVLKGRVEAERGGGSSSESSSLADGASVAGSITCTESSSAASSSGSSQRSCRVAADAAVGSQSSAGEESGGDEENEGPSGQVLGQTLLLESVGVGTGGSTSRPATSLSDVTAGSVVTVGSKRKKDRETLASKKEKEAPARGATVDVEKAAAEAAARLKGFEMPSMCIKVSADWKTERAWEVTSRHPSNLTRALCCPSPPCLFVDRMTTPIIGGRATLGKSQPLRRPQPRGTVRQPVGHARRARQRMQQAMRTAGRARRGRRLPWRSRSI